MILNEEDYHPLKNDMFTNLKNEMTIYCNNTKGSEEYFATLVRETILIRDLNWRTYDEFLTHWHGITMEDVLETIPERII